MRAMRWGLGALMLALLAPLAAAPAPKPADDKVTLRSVSYAELGDTLRSLKGKVVVVDFWAFW